jgi:hypothetical protein
MAAAASAISDGAHCHGFFGMTSIYFEGSLSMQGLRVKPMVISNPRPALRIEYAFARVRNLSATSEGVCRNCHPNKPPN